MNKYRADRPCPKCDCGHVHTRWLGVQIQGLREVIQRTCSNCGYKWDEAPLDAKTERTDD